MADTKQEVNLPRCDVVLRSCRVAAVLVIYFLFRSLRLAFLSEAYGGLMQALQDANNATRVKEGATGPSCGRLVEDRTEGDRLDRTLSQRTAT